MPRKAEIRGMDSRAEHQKEWYIKDTVVRGVRDASRELDRLGTSASS